MLYKGNGSDTLKLIEKFPLSSLGAPMPVVLGNEWLLFLVYLVQRSEDESDQVIVADPVGSADPVAVVRFEKCLAYTLGAPGDEDLASHPLASKGLTANSAFEVSSSSWVEGFRTSIKSDWGQDQPYFRSLKHVIVSFHDSTFECIAQRYSYEVKEGPLYTVVSDLVWELGGSSQGKSSSE